MEGYKECSWDELKDPTIQKFYMIVHFKGNHTYTPIQIVQIDEDQKKFNFRTATTFFSYMEKLSEIHIVVKDGQLTIFDEEVY